ncbi:MAG: manganese efflux pump [Nitrospirae bacterium]|nr:manganese efflux pump [Nitrospirota bacterium]
MTTLTILLIAVGLAMDAFAVSITSGLAIKQLRIRHALMIALSFGLFQAIMPVVGWFEGTSLRGFIEDIDHWVVFGILSIMGVKMIFESTKMDSDKKEQNPLHLFTLFMLSLATSIDALAVGLSLSFLKVSIIEPAIIIGLVTFVLSLIGVFIGERFGHFFEKKIEIAGGLILIGIGVKILIEHLVNGT